MLDGGKTQQATLEKRKRELMCEWSGQFVAMFLERWVENLVLELGKQKIPNLKFKVSKEIEVKSQVQKEKEYQKRNNRLDLSS